jgi:two-component system chemotaxis response regulator CheB
MAEMEATALQQLDRAGSPSVYGCPECGGVLWELNDGNVFHFRCRVGHAWSPDSLLARQTDSLEAALWTALRALEESAALSRRLADQARQRGLARAAARFYEQMQSAQEHALVIRNVLLSRKDPPETETVEETKAPDPGVPPDPAA